MRSRYQSRRDVLMEIFGRLMDLTVDICVPYANIQVSCAFIV